MTDGTVKRRLRTEPKGRVVTGPSQPGSPNAVRSLDLLAHRALLSPVTLTAGDDLRRVADRQQYVYFLDSGLVSISAVLAGGQAPGVQLAAAEDVVGLESVFLPEPAPTCAIVLVAGTAHRCAAASLARLCETEPALALRLGAGLATQNRALQVEVACCAHHGVEQRLARLLMGMAQKLNTVRLPVTQEQLASVLGVQRTTITALAGRLKAMGALSYLRGVIRVADPERLSRLACGCPV